MGVVFAMCLGILELVAVYPRSAGEGCRSAAKFSPFGCFNSASPCILAAAKLLKDLPNSYYLSQRLVFAEKKHGRSLVVYRF
ncbi:hypothetical protein BJ138DRAFT_939385 [Hygrophoropsis aurantiaca]|uniref:Uncharacterized protein n=1 Tax=Hygrophoropsis aurantiaca TaxID=72124 RepID=A0ACB8AEZ4_9AGAM|nr:hypothetical protein BJ138DRAFT_939385 [Hygrophoropsis aurantiaca]